MSDGMPMLSRRWLDRASELLVAVERDGKSFAELGRQYQVTRERIRQVYRVLSRITAEDDRRMT